MLSLKRPAAQPQSKEGPVYGALLRSACLILEGIGLHSLRHEGVQQDAFLAKMREFEAALTKGKTEASILDAAAESIKAIEIHNRQIELRLNARKKEVQAIVAFLISVIRESCEFNEQLLLGLDELERDFSGSDQPDDLHAVRMKFQEHLDAARVTRESAAFEETLQAGSSTGSTRESITGLPSREEAKASLAAATTSNKAFYAVALRVNSMKFVETRHGLEVSQEYLIAATQMIAQELREEDQLFHWSDAVLVALIERKLPAIAVRREATRLALMNREYMIDVDGRSVMFGIPVSSECFALKDWPAVCALTREIDRFALNQVSNSTN